MRERVDRTRPAGERARRTAVHLAMLFYILLLAEGPLRKWLLPSMSNALVFSRDPLMIALLIAGARLRTDAGWKHAWAAYSAIVLVFGICALAQLATGDAPPLALVAGFRNYFLFVPVAGIVGAAFRPADYARWLKLNLALAGPAALLVVAQYRASPTAFVNAAPGGENEGVFLLVTDVVRPYGLFSFTLGHSVYAAWMLGVALAGAFAPRSFGIKPALVALGGAGAIAMAAFSGSRTAFMLDGAVIMTAGVAIAMGGDPAARRRAFRGVAFVLGFGVALVALVPDLATNLIERQDVAVASEGDTVERIGRVLTDFVGELDRVPALGVGLGAGTNVAAYLSNGHTDRVLAEYELTRIVQELGPYFGLLVIGLRWGVAAALVRATVAAVRRGNLQPACFLGLVAPLLLVHDVTLQNSMIGIAWFSIGILLAALKAGRAAPPTAASVPAGRRPACA